MKRSKKPQAAGARTASPYRSTEERTVDDEGPFIAVGPDRRVVARAATRELAREQAVAAGVPSPQILSEAQPKPVPKKPGTDVDKLRLLARYLYRPGDDTASALLDDAASEIERLRSESAARAAARENAASFTDFLASEDTPIFETDTEGGKIILAQPCNEAARLFAFQIRASSAPQKLYVRRVIKSAQPKGLLGEALLAGAAAFLKRAAAEPPEVILLVNGKGAEPGVIPLDPATTEADALAAACKAATIDPKRVKKIMYVPGKVISLVVEKA